MAPPDVDAMITLKVDNVPFNAAAEDLKELFVKFGEVGDVYIPKSRASNESRGFAFIRFINKEDAEKAIAGMEGYEHEGRQLHVQYAKQRRPENPREFYRERDRGRDDRRYDDRGRFDDRRGGYDRGYDDRYDDRRGGYDRGYDDRGRGRYGRSRSPDRRDYRDRDRSRGRRSRSRSPRRDRGGSPPPRRD